MASPQSLALAPEGRTRGAVASVARSVGPGQTGTSSGLRGDRPRGAALCCSQVQRPSAQHECGHARPGGGSGVPRAEEWGSQGTFPGVAPATEGASHTPVTSVHGPTHTHPAPGSDAAGHTQTHAATRPAPHHCAHSRTPPLAPRATGPSPPGTGCPRQQNPPATSTTGPRSLPEPHSKKPVQTSVWAFPVQNFF